MDQTLKFFFLISAVLLLVQYTESEDPGLQSPPDKLPSADKDTFSNPPDKLPSADKDTFSNPPVANEELKRQLSKVRTVKNGAWNFFDTIKGAMQNVNYETEKQLETWRQSKKTETGKINKIKAFTNGAITLYDAVKDEVQHVNHEAAKQIEMWQRMEEIEKERRLLDLNTPEINKDNTTDPIVTKAAEMIGDGLEYGSKFAGRASRKFKKYDEKVAKSTPAQLFPAFALKPVIASVVAAKLLTKDVKKLARQTYK